MGRGLGPCYVFAMLARKFQRGPGPFTFEEYLDWEAEQEEKWELVDGYAVPRSDRWHWDPVEGMAGATRGHNLIVANLVRHLGNRLDDSVCRALPSDIKTRSPTGSSRYPDVTVECALGDLNSLLSAEPRILIEVLSPSNRPSQLLRLLHDYQAVSSVAQIVYLEQQRPFGQSWTRDGDTWEFSLK